MRIDRRHFLGGATALAGAVAMPAILTRRAYGQSGDTIRIAFSTRTFDTMDPSAIIQGVDEWPVAHVHDKLVELPRGRFAVSNDEFRPSLATAWEGSGDSKVWTFTLREGVPFHKGYGECTSDDVRFSFQRLIDASLPLFQNIAAIETDGPYRISFRLAQPDAFFISRAACHVNASVISRKAFEEKGDTYQRDPIGTGPYQLDRVDPNPTIGFFLTANTEYFDGPPLTPIIQGRYFPDTTARTLALLSGEVDIIQGVRAPGWVPTLQQQKPDLIFDASSPGSLFSAGINLTYPDFQDIRVRKAMFHAIDRDVIAQAMAPISQRAYGVVPSSFPGGYNADTIPEDVRYEHSPDLARSLLAEAGFGGGLNFDCFTSQREDFSSIMLIVQEQFRLAGINMNLSIMDHTAYHEENNKGVNTLSQRSVAYPPIPTMPFIEMLASNEAITEEQPNGRNFSRYGVAMPGIDDLLNQALVEPDFDKHVAIVQQIDHQVMADAVFIPLSNNGTLYVRNPNIDLGYEVVSGYAHWRLDIARIV